MARRVSFWATKKVARPTTVRFRRADGSVAEFNATKIVKQPVKVSFYSTRRRKFR